MKVTSQHFFLLEIYSFSFENETKLCIALSKTRKLKDGELSYVQRGYKTENNNNTSCHEMNACRVGQTAVQ